MTYFGPARSRRAGGLLTGLIALVASAPAAAGIREWTPVGPNGARAVAVRLDRQDPAIAYVATIDHLYKSTNGGATWSRRSSDALRQTGGFLVALEQAPSDPDVLYAVRSGAVDRSSDRGESWSHATLDPPPGLRTTYQLAISPERPTEIWAATRGGVFRSGDGGAHWAPTPGLPAPAAAVAVGFDPREPHALYALHHEAGLFRWSRSEGRWRLRGTPDGSVALFTSMAFDGRQAGSLLVIRCLHILTLDPTCGIHRTSDGGLSWSPPVFSFPASAFAEDLVVTPAAPLRLYALHRGDLYASLDGTTWERREPAPRYELESLTLDPIDGATLWATATDVGLVRSLDDGRSWTVRNRGLGAAEVLEFVAATVAGQPPWILGDGLGGLFSSRDGGAAWSYDSPFFFRLLAVDPHRPSTFYARSSLGAVRSSDGGETFEEIGPPSGSTVTLLLPDPRTPDRLFAFGDPFSRGQPECVIWRSETGGDPWLCLRTDTEAVLAADLSPLDAGRLSTGRLWSEDGGDSWNPSSGLPQAVVRAVRFSRRQAQNVWALSEGTLFASDDGGATFLPVASAAQASRTLQHLEVGLRADGEDVLYIASVSGEIWRSVDDGGSWERIDDGITEGSYTAQLFVDPAIPERLYLLLGTGELNERSFGEPSACIPGETTLCLAGGRFRLEARWYDPRTGRQGRAKTRPLTGDTGAFWFFRPDNLELMIKVLDGRDLNDHFWVFYGALSDVEYWITVTDTATGEKRFYHNPPKTLASRGDTRGFFAPPGESLASERLPERPPPSPRAHPGGDHCDVTSRTLCLAGRFRVEVEWTDFQGEGGRGTAVPLTGDTGVFWFFREENLELMIKVLDGRAVNGHFWVFYGALSNVAYTIRVTDVESGQSRTYRNPLRRFASRADTRAFQETP